MILNCFIGEGLSNGVSVLDGGRGRLQSCEIYSNAQPNIGVVRGGNPVVVSCGIIDSKASGVYVSDGGLANSAIAMLAETTAAASKSRNAR